MVKASAKIRSSPTPAIVLLFKAFLLGTMFLMARKTNGFINAL